MLSKNGCRLGPSSLGTDCQATSWNASALPFGRWLPNAFTIPRAALISSVLGRTSACRNVSLGSILLT
jgi:hypothetical protein